jgi:hypothetical protein
MPQRRAKAGATVHMNDLLNPGDQIEYSLTFSHNYNVVKSGATTTIQGDETVEEAQERLYQYVLGVAQKGLEELQ